MGAGELILVGVREAAVKYHSCAALCLTRAHELGREQGQAGSLTGAVASQTVTEAPKGSLSLDGNQALACNGVRELDCEADKPSRDESRA